MSNGSRSKWDIKDGVKPKPVSANVQRPDKSRGSAQPFCYVCRTSHVWADPCPPVPRHRASGQYIVRPWTRGKRP